MKRSAVRARAACGLIACIAIGSAVAAEKFDLDSRLQALVKSERAFSAAAGQGGTRKAFLEYLGVGSIIFRQGPLDGRAAFYNGGEQKGVLSWTPVFADISSGGDIGYTTGPWEYREKKEDERPSQHGQFFSIWRRQVDGSWRVALDIGTTNPPPAEPPAALEHPALKQRAGSRAMEPPSREGLEKQVLDLDIAFASECVSKGAAEAYRNFADGSIRILRDGAFPVAGRRAVVAALPPGPGKISWTPERAGAGSAGDLAYTYGAYRIAGETQDAPPVESGSYVRVFKSDGHGRFRAVADVFHPGTPG